MSVPNGDWIPFDDNGNTLSKVTDADNQATYDWDFENRLVRAEVTEDGVNTVVEYQYDADGIRVAKIVDGVETRFLVDKNRAFAQVLEEYSPSGTVAISEPRLLRPTRRWCRGSPWTFLGFDTRITSRSRACMLHLTPSNNRRSSAIEP